MDKEDVLDCDDLGEALREDRPLRHARSYRILFAQGNLEFQPLAVPDPVPLGRQILEAAGLKPEAGYSLFGILPSGDFEDVRLDEAFDLREKGAERFVAFLTDRTFKLTLDDAQIEWGEPVMNGAVLYELAKLSNEEAVFLDVPGGKDRLIDPGRNDQIWRSQASSGSLQHQSRDNDVRDHRQLSSQDSSGSKGDFRADRSACLSRAARGQCRFFHDLSPCRLQASMPANSARVGVVEVKKEGDNFQCHPDRSIIVLI